MELFHLKKIDSGLKSYRQHSKGVERKVSTVIIDLKKRMEGEAESESGADNCITLEEGCAVNLEDLEKNMVEKYSLLAAKESDFQDLFIKMSSEVERLRADNNEKSGKATYSIDMATMIESPEVRINSRFGHPNYDLEPLIIKKCGMQWTDNR